MRPPSGTDTIIALSSGQGRAGVAVLRISGPRAFQLALDLTSKRLPPPREAGVRWVLGEDGSRLDQVLLIRFSGPESFTGEDIVELHCHGSPAVVSAILELSVGTGYVRLAEAGEFSRRAFENGKLDLLQAEGIGDLIHSDTAEQMKQAARFVAGDASETLLSWRKKILEASAYLAASIDFSDEGDVSDDVHTPAVAVIRDLERVFQESLRDAETASRVRDGIRIAILGKPNAGKSTLINALVSREAAIVSDIPGTTRDVLEAQLVIAGVPVTIADTAGLRESDDPIEVEGVRRARAWSETADIRIYLTRLDQPDLIDRPTELGEGDIWIGSQADRQKDYTDLSVDLEMSVHERTGLSTLMTLLVDRVTELTRSVESPVIVRLRHKQSLERALEALATSRYQLTEFGDVDLAEFELSIARSALDQILGRVDVEDILGEVFSGFCVGK